MGITNGIVSLKCKDCNNAKPCLQIVRILKEKPKCTSSKSPKHHAKKIDKYDQVVETISEKTERVEHSLTFKELYQGLVTCKKVYTCHKFQVFNDQFH